MVKKLCAIRRSFDRKTLNFSHAIFIDRCYCHREAAVMTDDDTRAFLFTLDILRTYIYMYFASLFELFEYLRYVDSFRGSCRVARLEIVWSNVASSDAYDTSTNGKVY